MKRFGKVLLLCLFSILLIGRAERAEAGHLLTAVVTNSTATRTDNLIALTTIIPGKHRVLGFKVTPYGAGCVDPYVELHDYATAAGISTSTIFDALEADTNPLRSETQIFPLPKDISLGVVVRLGGYTAVTVYYERAIQ